jgi:hypothetical protein
LIDSNNDLVIENKWLKIENEQIKKDKHELEKENAFLKKTLERIKELFRQKVPELANMIGYVKASILDKAKEKLLKRYFVDDAEIKGAQNFMVDKQEQEKQLPSGKQKNQDYEMER